MKTVFFILMLVAMFLVLIAMSIGIFVMAKGGDTNIKYGNKLMKARVILQGVALAFFVLALSVTD